MVEQKNKMADKLQKTKDQLQKSHIWQDSVGGLQRLWQNYLQLLSRYFKRMSRDEQEEMITIFSLILSIGGATLIWYQIYTFLLPIIRLFAFPASLIAAYWFGKKIVSPMMIARLSKYLNE